MDTPKTDTNALTLPGAYLALDSACLDEANGHRMDFHAYLEEAIHLLTRFRIRGIWGPEKSKGVGVMDGSGRN